MSNNSEKKILDNFAILSNTFNQQRHMKILQILIEFAFMVHENSFDGKNSMHKIRSVRFIPEGNVENKENKSIGKESLLTVCNAFVINSLSSSRHRLMRARLLRSSIGFITLRY